MKNLKNQQSSVRNLSSPISKTPTDRRRNSNMKDNGVTRTECRPSHEVSTRHEKASNMTYLQQQPNMRWGWSRSQIRWWGRASIILVVLVYYGWNLRLGHRMITIGSFDSKNENFSIFPQGGTRTPIFSTYSKTGSQNEHIRLMNGKTNRKRVKSSIGKGNEEYQERPSESRRTSHANSIYEIDDVTRELFPQSNDALPDGFRLRSAWGNDREALKTFLSVINPSSHETPILKKNATQPLIQIIFPFHHDWHPRERQGRFPSVEDRVAIYAGEVFWLNKACQYSSAHNPIEGASEVPNTKDPERPSYISFPNGTVVIPPYMIRKDADEKTADFDKIDNTPQHTQNDLTTVLTPHFRGGLRSFTMFPATHSSWAVEEASRWLHPLSDITYSSKSKQSSGVNDKEDGTTIRISPNPRNKRNEPNNVLSLRRQEITKCANNSKHMYYKYCRDSLTLLDTADEILHLDTATGTSESDLSMTDISRSNQAPPILVRFSDSEEKWNLKSREVVDVPIFKKFRNILPSDKSIKENWNIRQKNRLSKSSKRKEGDASGNSDFYRVCNDRLNTFAEEDIEGSTMTMREWEPFVWNLNSHRHYRHVPTIPYVDRPWYMKRNAAVWRGAMSGREAIRHRAAETVEECHLVPRCRLVLAHLDRLSEVQKTQVQPHSDEAKPDVKKLTEQVLVDAKFATCVSGKDQTVGAKPIDTHPMFTSPCSNRLEVKQMLEYKVIIMLEGNDVASGLKWALFSQSVVLMPKPTRMTWAMEMWLEPWVHYVPIDDDLSNVEERVQWILDHDQDSKRIAERATLFMYDLLYHPQAKAEEKEVKQELLKLYWSTFSSPTAWRKKK